MSDGIYERESSLTGWFVGIIVALALLCIGYLVFAANRDAEPELTPDQTRCMIANPGKECTLIHRWEPSNVSPSHLSNKEAKE